MGIIMQENEKNSACCNLEKIASEFYGKIWKYVIKKVHNETIASDITQEVMVCIINAYNKNILIKNVSGWLFRVTNNVISDYYRKNNLVLYDEKNVDLPAEKGNFELSAEDFIIPMLNLLPEKYRIPLYMSDIENVKQAEIAQKLNLSLSAVKMRCQRGRMKLHQLFEECCDIEYTKDGAFSHCTLKASCDVLLKEQEKMIGQS